MQNSLIATPAFQSTNFAGYQHFIDQTRQPFNTLTYPSCNCTIPNFDKIIPDNGKTLYGQIFNENVPMVGNKQKFTNLGGIEMEVRVFPSEDTDLKDVIQAGFENKRMVVSGISGSFSVGESISGQTSGALGVVTDIVGTVIFLKEIQGTFTVGETILGQISLATATTVKVPETKFYQITENVNPLPYGAHEYYFDTWFSTNLNPANSENLPRLVWVNGCEATGYPGQGAVFSWTGGIAVITSFTSNSITINPATTWRSLGFTEDISGSQAIIVVNGVLYIVDDPTDLDTNTVNITLGTTGIAIGDLATSYVEEGLSPIIFDVCRQVKGYMYYGNWKNYKLYQSNAFNRPSDYTITNFTGGLLNDLVIDSGTNLYTGTKESVYNVIIDSIQPNINEQTFTPGGEGNMNDAFYNTGAYSGSAGVTNKYGVSVVADYTVVILTGTTDWIVGHIIKGGTSNAEGIIIYRVNSVVAPAADYIAIKLLTTNAFQTNETITDVTSSGGTTATAQLTFANDWIQATKNGIVFNTTTDGQGAQPISFLTPDTPTITLVDGLTITFSNFRNHAVGDTFILKINQGGIDTFKWQKDGGAFSGSTPITTNFQALSDGVQIKFLNFNGHSIGDSWKITAIPEVTRAWDNFYYALPVRRPGEGYIYQLPSAFWTMDTQEDSMYVNSSYGEWSVIKTQLSADLQSESVSLEPLKQAGANKVLYPYLTGHINDDLIYINTEKSLDSLGRKEFLEKPQTGYLSDPVKLDFQASSFIDGRIKYFGKRLYITSPQDGIMHCYDTYKKYWQPPKKFPEMGILTIIGNKLACHSYTRNQTFTLFTNTAGDNGFNYEVNIRTPYIAPNGIWKSTFSNMSFVEGYVTGNPPMSFTVYEGVNGCGGILSNVINPVMCIAPDRSPFGEGSFGSHSFSSDQDVQGNYFNWISKKYSPVMQYYLVSLGLSCSTKSHTYSILSMGLNGMNSPTDNNSLVDPTNLVINNED